MLYSIETTAMNYLFFANVRISPNKIESEAAKITLYWSGSKKVMVWAGIQNSGMVLPTTNFMKVLQSIVEIVCETEILLPENFASIHVSVMRWAAINTGPKVRFMIAEM